MDYIILTPSQLFAIVFTVGVVLYLAGAATGYFTRALDEKTERKARPDTDCKKHDHRLLTPCVNGKYAGNIPGQLTNNPEKG